jgi:hypothetical protein
MGTKSLNQIEHDKILNNLKNHLGMSDVTAISGCTLDSGLDTLSKMLHDGEVERYQISVGGRAKYYLYRKTLM